MIHNGTIRVLKFDMEMVLTVLKLVKQISKKNQDATGEKLSTFYLFQSILMAIQWDNAVCVMGCVKEQSSGLEGLFKFQVHEAEEL